MHKHALGFFILNPMHKHAHGYDVHGTAYFGDVKLILLIDFGV